MDFGKEENIKYNKSYLNDKKTKESEIKTIMNDKQKFEVEFSAEKNCERYLYQGNFYE